MPKNHLGGLLKQTAGSHPRNSDSVGLGEAKESAFIISSQVTLMLHGEVEICRGTLTLDFVTSVLLATSIKSTMSYVKT